MLSDIANQTNEPDSLIKLHKVAEETTSFAHEMIKTDIDKSESGHPWRILNLNHGIIASRTHNTNIIYSVFKQLLLYLPYDVAIFYLNQQTNTTLKK